MTQLTTSIADTNPTTRFFNNIYNPVVGVSQNINDAIYSYFEQYTQNKDSAKILTQVVISTAQEQNLDPLVVLTDFQKLDNNELNAYLALFLNLSRVPTSLLGVKVPPVTNPYISRSILF